MELLPLFFLSALQQFISEVFDICNIQRIQGPGAVYLSFTKKCKFFLYLGEIEKVHLEYLCCCVSHHSSRSDDTVCVQNMSA